MELQLLHPQCLYYQVQLLLMVLQLTDTWFCFLAISLFLDGRNYNWFSFSYIFPGAFLFCFVRLWNDHFYFPIFNFFMSSIYLLEGKLLSESGKEVGARAGSPPSIFIALTKLITATHIMDSILKFSGHGHLQQGPGPFVLLIWKGREPQMDENGVQG